MSDLVGCKLITKFGEDGYFKGHIDKYCKKRGHHIKYDDGDNEWVQKLLVGVMLCLLMCIYMHTFLTLQEDDEIQIVKKPRRMKPKVNNKPEISIAVEASKGRSISGQSGKHNRVLLQVVL